MPHQPGPTDNLLSYLLFNPWDGPLAVLGGAVWITILYLIAVWRLRPEDEPQVPRWKIASFLGANVAVVVALVSPLHVLADHYLFTAHMAQHLLLIMVMPVLLLLGTPGWMLTPILKLRPIRYVAILLTFPPLAYFLYNGIFAASHVPWLYDVVLAHEQLHALEHTVFMLTALVAWWPALSPSALVPRLAPPLAVFYLFLHTFPMLMVGAMVTDASVGLYAVYAAAPRLWDLSVLQDQQTGGLLMWIGGSVFYLAVITTIFFRWANREDQKEPRYRLSRRTTG